MPSFQEFLDLLNQIFPNQVQQILTVVLILVGLWWALDILSKIKSLWVKEFTPLFYSPEEKRRVARRRRFADHIETEIRRLDNLEAWSDYRFAELEAEVEAEGRQRVSSILPFLQGSRSGLRREKSLSKALETSQERLILVEGEPGSGKSVALRHVAQSMARRAMKALSSKNIVPIYINLKELKPLKGESIDKNLIQAFVLRSLNRANDRDIEEFLESEFTKGLQERTWLFLFDSFDEIPDVLSSTEADAIIRTYADAISDFLHGMNSCRGIVASRQFRGPGHSGWPRFRILQLSEPRRAELVRKADLSPELQTTIVGQLGIAGDEIRGMVSNPMFLGLLCEYMRAGHSFPQNAHSVFETYVETRLTRDQERLQRRFKLKPKQMRSTAENVAFCMAADPGLGLTPTRESIAVAMKSLGFQLPKNFFSHLDALEYIKLARSETATAAGDSKPFTFAHRRFQEYFATCIVLNEQKRVAPKLLLTDARWRETAVVICQTQPADLLLPIIKESRKIVTGMKRALPELMDTPFEGAGQSQSTAMETDKLPNPFPWPPGLLHLAGLLQDGFVNRLKDLPNDIRSEIGRILSTASKSGTLFDRKWALEVAGTVPLTILIELLRDAFASSSQWLSDVAFRQTARLSEIPEDIARSIRRSLLGLFVAWRLRSERHATHAHLARLDKSADFTAILRLLLFTAPVDLAFHFILFTFFAQFILIMARVMREENSPFNSLVWIIPSLILLIVFSHRSLQLLAAYYRGVSYPQGWANWVKSSHTQAVFVIILAVELRLLLLPSVVLLALYLLSSLVSPFMLLILTLLSFTITFWAPFALGAAVTGQFTHPVWWPFMLVWPLLYFMRNVQKSLNALWIWSRRNWITLIFVLIFFAGIIRFETNPIFLVVIAGAALFGVIGFFLFLAFSMIIAILLVLDWVNWYRWTRIKMTPLTTQEFLRWATNYRYGIFRNRFVKTVREQGLLIAGKETEILVSRLALEIEHAIFARNRRDELLKKSWWMRLRYTLRDFRNTLKEYLPQKDSVSLLNKEDQSKLTSADLFDVWLANYQQDNKERLAGWGSEFLDEVWKLSEQVRGSRRVTSNPVQGAIP